MRELSQSFMHNLIDPQGILHPILTRVKSDQTLMFAIRDGFINIYYRGGSILKISEPKTKSGNYQTSFDDRYNRSGIKTPNLPKILQEQDDVRQWMNGFPQLKLFMDDFYSKVNKPEREFQQLVARENNNSSISNASEYFISDIEVSESITGARFDMLAIRWLATQRRSGENCKLALIEMKYGDGALSGNAGMLKHLQDIDALIVNKEKYSKLVEVIAHQFEQLDQLGLLNFNKGKKYTKVMLHPNDKPEVIFILANHNPRATELKSILNSPEIVAYSESKDFDLRFFVSSFAGYGLHVKCMFDLNKFRLLLENYN
jgi:hypothetical protein